jgi:hypothetical protein
MSTEDDTLKNATPNDPSDPQKPSSEPLFPLNSISQRIKTLFTGATPSQQETLDELQLQRYLEGRLDAVEAAKIVEILKYNPAARRTLDALREESDLIRLALEPRIEASKRIADKVLLTLHHEERFRLNASRNRRLRRQVMGGLAAAASVMLCLWLIKPRDPAGALVSGTSATLVSSNGERHTLTKNSPVYEGDTIQTAMGQFLRIRTADGSLLDIDEHSTLELEKIPSAALKLTEGRIGVDATSARRDVIVHFTYGSVKIPAGTLADIGWVKPSAAVSPSLFVFETTADSSRQSEPSAQSAVVLTVIRGADLLTTEHSSDVPVIAGQRTLITASSRMARKVNMSTSKVLETRGDNGWHSSSNGNGPQDRRQLGLMQTPRIGELASRLQLDQRGLTALKDALDTLDKAMLEKNPAQRAQQLSLGQQALRAACEPLDPTDECRRFGRMLEGLAHMQRGFTLLEIVSTERNATAYIAFTAASVAFDEAQQPIRILGQPLPSKPIQPTWFRTLCENGIPVDISTLSAIDQSWLNASFHFPIAELWRARTAENALQKELASHAATEFFALRSDRDNPSHEPLGRSVELFAAMLGESLALELAGEPVKACDVLHHDLMSTPIVGMNATARAHCEGIRQAAFLTLTRIYSQTDEWIKAQNTAADFWLLYPLEEASSMGQKINSLVAEALHRQATSALNAKQYQHALSLIDELLSDISRYNVESITFDLRLKCVLALVGLKSKTRALLEIEKLATSVPSVPPERQQEFDALQKIVKALNGNP